MSKLDKDFKKVGMNWVGLGCILSMVRVGTTEGKRVKQKSKGKSIRASERLQSRKQICDVI